LIGIHDLPAVNATLNGTAAVLLVWGYVLIRRREIAMHKKVMLAAFSVSVAFLICYITYHVGKGGGVTKFQKTGWIRGAYFFILTTHTILAATVPFLAVFSLRHAFGERFQKHRAIARWTLPIWLYVSVTGVVVYLMLYRM
jgi:putative membrane protein